MHIQQPLEIPSFKHLPTEDGRRAARRLWVAAFGESTAAFVAADWLTQEMLVKLRKNLAFTKIINRAYDAGFRPGDIIKLQ